MAFGDAHPRRIRNAFIRACLDDGMSVNEAHALALEGRLPNVRPDEVPPIGTCRSWRTDAARLRETEAIAGTEQGSDEMVNDVLSKITLELVAEHRRLSRKRPRATPDEWATLAKAAGAVGKARREANGPEKKTRTPAPQDASTGAGNAESSDTAKSWLDGIDPDA